MKRIIILLILTLITVSACTTSNTNSSLKSSESDDDTYNKEVNTDGLTQSDIDRGIKITEDGVKYLVNPNKIRGGGPAKDGIPSLDNPKFVSVKLADDWIDDDELVLGLIYKGVKRVYPLQVMVWHELVNDFIADDPILITYCPLCGSGIAYDRTIDGEAVEFGTSGKLYNSNLVMYDRKTDSYWAQIGGVAIMGDLTGYELTPISIDTVTWGEWKNLHSDSEVLSKDTGFIRSYGSRDPYKGYYENNQIWFDLENEDDSVHPKTVIFGIEINGVYKAYKEADLKEAKIITDVVNGVNIEVKRNTDGIVKIKNLDSGEEIVKERDFWFAWYAFHPETTIYDPAQTLETIAEITNEESEEVLLEGVSIYKEFNIEEYEQALLDNKIVMLYFFADWCPICKVEQVHTIAAFEEMKNSNLIGFRVNYKDSDTEEYETNLAKEYGIIYQHTKVIIKDREEVFKALDSWGKERYLNELKRFV